MKDEDLLRELVIGCESALESLIHRYHQPLYGYVYRMTMNEQTTADIVQDTFMNLYRHAQYGRVPEQLKPWIYKIATNLCKDYWKKASTRHEIPWARDSELFEMQTIHIMDHQIERQWMLESLNQLHLDHRIIIYLRFYQDLSYEQISETLEIPLNTVKSRLFRGLKQLEAVIDSDQYIEERNTRKSSLQRRGGL
ncbi:RNA polymerase sigma factor [Paenibacillus sp. EC2-1]|uniref:RNA polymerase sigma factor n=1 Tax=Paenibacillus sp. EC2-1 TaxID=3388665 RepID=UPI003BEEBBAE